MNPMKTMGDAAERAVYRAEQFAPFGKAERLTAGICMGIPFFLIAANVPYIDRQWWWFTALALFFVILPFAITYLARTAHLKNENHGLFITVLFGVVLTLLYLLFREVFDITSLNSISAYVGITDSFIFGALLSIGAMLFIANGLVYWDEHKKQIEFGGRSRGYINVILGIALQGVVLFPCTRLPNPHYFFAITFFAGCAFATILRNKKKTKHKIMDYSIAGVMVAGFVLLLLKELFHLKGWFFEWINLFGAESVGLWVIGIDFILVSLKRMPDTETVSHKQVQVENAKMIAKAEKG